MVQRTVGYPMIEFANRVNPEVPVAKRKIVEISAIAILLWVSESPILENPAFLRRITVRRVPNYLKLVVFPLILGSAQGVVASL